MLRGHRHLKVYPPAFKLALEFYEWWRVCCLLLTANCSFVFRPESREGRNYAKTFYS